jgi:hypothetical protein
MCSAAWTCAGPYPNRARRLAKRKGTSDGLWHVPASRWWRERTQVFAHRRASAPFCPSHIACGTERDRRRWTPGVKPFKLWHTLTSSDLNRGSATCDPRVAMAFTAFFAVRQIFGNWVMWEGKTFSATDDNTYINVFISTGKGKEGQKYFNERNNHFVDVGL